MTVGERIKQRREELGLSQMQLAIKMGYKTRAAISRAETSGDEIGAARVKKFADALGVSPSYLMGWSNDVDYILTLEDGSEVLVEAYKNTTEERRRIVMEILGLNSDDLKRDF